MKKLIKEVLQELLIVLSGKSLDVILPPILFIVLYGLFDIIFALIGSFILSIVFLGLRLLKKDNLYYTLGGFIGVIFAGVMTIINNNASNFFLPDLIATVTLIIITIGSLIVKKPLALWVSHITRGWELEWFNRDDVKPAYNEVTIFWLGFFIIRFVVEISLYLNSSVDKLAIANIIMGLPITIVVLTISYIYGIWRLHNLSGPGVDEFREGKEPPYRGQNRGF